MSREGSIGDEKRVMTNIGESNSKEDGDEKIHLDFCAKATCAGDPCYCCIIDKKGRCFETMDVCKKNCPYHPPVPNS